MKLSDRLYEKAPALWKEACNKPFVKEMALGTLDEARFRYYMTQDYLYLLDYIDILKNALEYTEDPELRSFICEITEGTEHEVARVHIPNMQKAGINIAEAGCARKTPAIAEYIDFMRQIPAKDGPVAMLTALLQCSWGYAFIGERMTERYAAEIAASPYRSWFESYTCAEYTEANRQWIDFIDSRTKEISCADAEKLCDIFTECAVYENRFWDDLYCT